MKKIIIIIIFFFGTTSFVFSKENCKELPGFKKIGKESVEYIKCLTKINQIGKIKLKTESKLTDIIKGEKKLKLPNPMNGLRAIGKAIKPSVVKNK